MAVREFGGLDMCVFVTSLLDVNKIFNGDDDLVEVMNEKRFTDK